MKTNLVTKDNYINKSYDFIERVGTMPDEIPLPKKIPVPQKNKKPQLKKVKKTEKEILKYQEKQTNKKAIKFAMILSAFFLMFIVMINSFVMKNDTRNSLDDVKREHELYVVAQEEVDTKLNAVLVKYDINKMALEKFGMIKVTPENSVYMFGENETGNKVIYSKE